MFYRHILVLKLRTDHWEAKGEIGQLGGGYSGSEKL